jgi:tetratricopeptide (TPR) repeat protein
MDPFASLVDLGKQTNEKKSLNGLSNAMTPLQPSTPTAARQQMKNVEMEFSTLNIAPPRATPSPSLSPGKPNVLNGAKQDIFGDFVSFTKTTNSLAAVAQHQKETLANTWDLGFLENAGSKPSTPSKQVQSVDAMDILGDFAPVKPSTPATPKPPNTKPETPTKLPSPDILGDFAPVKPSTPATPKPPNTKPETPTKPPSPPSKGHSLQAAKETPKLEKTALPYSDMDRAMATIMDMGFDAETAKLAIMEADGDVEHAIDRLLEQRSKLKSQKKTQSTNLATAATDFGTQLFGTASSMFSYSKKKIGKAIKIAKENLAEVLDDYDIAPSRKAYKEPKELRESSFKDSDDEKPKTPPRPTVYATAEQLQTAEDAKAKGNELFKRGQFSDAEACYTDAIAALPIGHEFLLFLFNNRAAARLKTGDYRGVLADCDAVQQVDDADVKSLLRRAMAHEGLEKWESAALDYKRILEIDSTVATASQGLARCSRAHRLDPETIKPKATPPEPSDFESLDPHSRFPSRPASTTPKPVSTYVANAQQAAVDRLREQDKKQLEEDEQRLAAKDGIDRKVYILYKLSNCSIGVVVEAGQGEQLASFARLFGHGVME